MGCVMMMVVNVVCMSHDAQEIAKSGNSQTVVSKIECMTDWLTY